MFRQIITDTSSAVTEGTCTEREAIAALRTAVQRGYRVEANRQGGAVIVRDVWKGAHTPQQHTVTLKPVTPAGKLSETWRRDLAVVSNPTGRRTAWLTEDGRISAGFYSVPPGTSRRLIEGGLVTVGEPVEPAVRKMEGRPAVYVSVAARLAMLAQEHATRTMEPRGYYRPADYGVVSAGRCTGGGTSGLMHDRTSSAICACRWSAPADDREDARRRAHGHRQDRTAVMVRAIYMDGG
jgi:hypothetical protein